MLTTLIVATAPRNGGRGYSVAKVVSGDGSKDAEIRQLERALARVAEERDILKKPPRISLGLQSDSNHPHQEW
mgnify:FL=1